MKIFSRIYILLITVYILIYKIFLVFYSDFIQYIINPLIWIIFSIVGYLFLYKNNKHYYKYEKNINYIIIISSLLYVLLFYSLGFLVGFGNNPYSKEISGIIINLFSILLIIGLNQFIRGILINEVLEKTIVYKLIITLIFIINDLNIIMIVNNLSNQDILFVLIIKYIIPVVSINVFLTYLNINGGYLPGIIYKTILIIPTLLIPITPKYDIIIPTLFDILIPVFTYLIIRYQINKQNKNNKEIPIKPNKWILTFLITIFLLMFSLGIFQIKPIVVLTGSMKPNIKEGDLLIIESCLIEDIKKGEIIEYKVDNYNVVHRVIEIKKNNSDYYLVTKGDNNLKEDKLPVTKDNLVGCYKYRIPYLGYPSYLVRKLFSKNVDI